MDIDSEPAHDHYQQISGRPDMYKHRVYANDYVSCSVTMAKAITHHR